jgi:sulfur-carrier protein
LSAQPVMLVYFAWVRERIGKPSESVVLPADVQTIGDLMVWLVTQGEEYAYAFENAPLIRAALDQKHVSHDALIAGAREIAFFPPMTGG